MTSFSSVKRQARKRSIGANRNSEAPTQFIKLLENFIRGISCDKSLQKVLPYRSKHYRLIDSGFYGFPLLSQERRDSLRLQ